MPEILQLYSFPGEKEKTQSGDEYWNKVSEQWGPVPEKSIGLEIEGVLVRRPFVGEPITETEKAIAIVRDIERTIASIGIKFSILQKGLKSDEPFIEMGRTDPKSDGSNPGKRLGDDSDIPAK